MKPQEFEKVVYEQLQYCLDLLTKKGKEYDSGEGDRLASFKRAAVLQDVSQKEALAGMMAKHTVSIYEMCEQGEYPVEKWIEKITDSINYLLILRAMVEEEKNEKH